jgi:hypothetical protein
LNPNIEPPHFRERFALAAFSDGGIAVDLVTGTYVRLNRSATAICEALAATDDVAAARASIGQRLRVGEIEAAQAIVDVIAGLQIPGPRRDRPDPFVYAFAPDGNGYVLSGNDVPRLWASADGLMVRLASTNRLSVAHMSEYLRAIAPRLLFLQGAAVLHGAACHGPWGAAFAICGDSGSGKTTTARAFDAAGARLFAEDMLVVASASPLSVHLGGEEAIRGWAIESADRLTQTAQIETSGLRAAFNGPPVPLTELWFIAADQRLEVGDRIVSRRLGATEAALTIMTSLFLGATSPQEWRRFLELAGAIAVSTSILEARMPRGIDRLQHAAELYRENSA